MTGLTAKKVSIALGSLEFDGYMIEGQLDEDGLPVFGFNLTQAAMMLGLTNEAKQAKQRVLDISKGKYAQTHCSQGFGLLEKVKGETSSGVKRSLTIIPIAGFEKLLLCVSALGKPQAVEIQFALTAYSLRKIFSRSFGEVFTDEMAENRIAARFVGIETRNDWTDQIKLWTLKPEASENDRKWIYANCSDRLNKVLTGHSAKYWRDKFDCDASTLRNHWNDRHLHDIEAIENLAAKILKRKQGNPMEALDEAIELLDGKVNPTPEKDNQAFDRTVYMKEYMREKRLKEKMQ